MRCLYCDCEFAYDLSLREIFGAAPIDFPQLCDICKRKFTKIRGNHFCYGCHHPCNEQYCQECKRWRKIYPNYDFHHESLYEYDQGMREWFEAYKFQGNYSLRATFSKEINQYFKKHKGVIVVPIPLSPARLWARGFNQVSAMLEASNVPYEEVLEKRQEIDAQSSKNRLERLNLEQPFQINKKLIFAIAQRDVVIVDDIYTTGRTIFHAADRLRTAGNPKSIQTFSLAR